MRKIGCILGAGCIAIALAILSAWGGLSSPEVRFFLLRASTVRHLPDPVQGILTTHPPLPVLLALAFRESFPLVTGWGIAFTLLCAGAKRGNALFAFLALLSPAFLSGVLLRPALTLFSLFAAFGFSRVLESLCSPENTTRALLSGNLVFGFSACLHPFGLWLLPLFALCEAFLPRVPPLRRGTLVALALFPFLVLEGMTLFFGWVYEGYYLAPFRDPALSLGVFLGNVEMPLRLLDILPLIPLLVLALSSGLPRTLLFLGVTLGALLSRPLGSPPILLPSFLFVFDPKPPKGSVLGILGYVATGWVLVACGFSLC